MVKDYYFLDSYTKVKGILILYNNQATKIKNLKVSRDGQLLEYSFKTNNDWVIVVACYPPPDIDDPSFLLGAKTC